MPGAYASAGHDVAPGAKGRKGEREKGRAGVKGETRPCESPEGRQTRSRGLQIRQCERGSEFWWDRSSIQDLVSSIGLLRRLHPAVDDRVDVHTGAHGREDHRITGLDALAVHLPSHDEIEQGRDGRH